MLPKTTSLLPKITSHQRGESLVEVMVAIGVLAIVLVSVFALLGTAMGTHRNVNNRIKAIDLAREGIEMVRNLRDTNWLRYSGNIRENWLCYQTDGGGDNNDCDHANDRIGGAVSSGTTEYFAVDATQDIVSGDYIVKPSGSQQELDITNFIPSLPYRLYQHDTTNEITHSPTGATATGFYRQIQVMLDANDTCGGDCPETRAFITVVIQWIEPEDQLRELRIQTVIYDFFNRESYTN